MEAAPKQIVDTWVFYKSEHDPGMWVGHSLNTDQIALGGCVLEALVELRKVVRRLLREAAKDSKIRVLQPAPLHVRQRLQGARPIPQDMVDRADELIKRARSKRPRLRGERAVSVDLGLVKA